MFRLPRSLAPQVAPTAEALCLQSSQDVYTTHSPVRYLPARALTAFRLKPRFSISVQVFQFGHVRCLAWQAGLPRDVASLRIRHEQLIRLDFHQLDCSLVGRSDVGKFVNLPLLSNQYLKSFPLLSAPHPSGTFEGQMS